LVYPFNLSWFFVDSLIISQKNDFVNAELSVFRFISRKGVGFLRLFELSAQDGAPRSGGNCEADTPILFTVSANGGDLQFYIYFIIEK
jgi:hypothetical protein